MASGFSKSPLFSRNHLYSWWLFSSIFQAFISNQSFSSRHTEIIWSFLKTLGLKVDDKHKFGPLHYTLKQLLTGLWVRQLYLEYSKDPDSVAGEEPVYLFNWGFRAQCEVNKKALLTFVSQVYDAHVQIETWHEQYDLALANHRLGEDDSMEN